MSEQSDTTGKDQTSAKAGETLQPDEEHVTHHSITIDGHAWRYDATAGTITIDTETVRPAASIFYTAFTAVGESGEADIKRPVTFIFNGGPGSASTFLMMGSVGPKRINIPDAAPQPAAPYELSDNTDTLLPASDLVFVDAAGAGFSQIAEEAKKELWSVDGDVKGFSAFIRAWLSRHHRWNSPKYILGESYGTTRGAALAFRLQQDGVALNGLTLLSNILDYAFTFDTSDQYYIGYFPTYAAIAKYHGKAGQGIDMARHLQTARDFANGPLRQALWKGDRLGSDERALVSRRYAELTGLDERYVSDCNLRVMDDRFRKQLLRDEDSIVGRYDGRVRGLDMDRVSETETFVVDDNFLEPPYSSLANAYLRDDLGWQGRAERKSFAGFDWNSPEPGKGWTWWHQLPPRTLSSFGDKTPFPKVTPDLAAAISRLPTLKVLVCNGIYDLATPFGQTEYDIDHLGLAPSLRSNIAFTYYPAGHMVYTSTEGYHKFADDLKRFYASDTAGMPALNERTNQPARPEAD
ncbi:S10 family peptidase [Bifidobacterium xylocopae]|uniref:Carboxypeptidase n=1 Tax=Bifidobacterium xylocopae TaxID=2493119 RepID=A0A366KDJ4_9BIFI|nr:carboxypeptidase [Bifidobacterium xylocopae]RBP99806.1 carboxypeptidase [Bifidobacterium xylocopae]